jgi:hypothetical protein
MAAEKSPPDAAAEMPPQDGARTVPTQAGSEELPKTIRDVPVPTPTVPFLPDYEILGVLGRGGMGVVYKARHLLLDRIVALKMIRAAATPGSEETARFLTEARAVARLQHMNIVQIYDIGEHAGQPFFSLEFVDGPSLEKWLAGRPHPARPAAELVETLARAVHAAHERGIIHRDLKPANILLQKDEGGRMKDEPDGSDSSFLLPPSSFQPKVTDFGLAKHLDAAVGQTKSGAIMGTPSYMAPEQASGRGHEVGPRTDVYGLGAILYELLTGRPPFRAATVVATLQQVCFQEPVPPSRYQPRLHRDLETICLQALAKEPARRYASALALAEDLGRFNAGEAILARREGVLRRLARRARRNPIALLSAGVLLAALVVGFVAVREITGRTDRLVALTGDIEDELRAPDLSDMYWRHVDARITDLGRLAPEKEGPTRQRLDRCFGERIRAELGGRLTDETMVRINAALRLLAEHDVSLAADLTREYEQRCRVWEQEFELSQSAGNPDELFAPGTVRGGRVGPDSLLEHVPGAPLVLMRRPCVGNVELKAVFAPSWEVASRLGLLLNVDGKDRYELLLRVPEGDGTAGSFQAVRALDGFLLLEVVRSGKVLRQRQVPAAALGNGPLRLLARREGDRLTCQVNDLASLSFQDAFPLRRAGVFGLDWPEGVPLRALWAAHQPLPRRPSPLELGDELFARGPGYYDEALACYQQQAVAARDPELGQEASYKAALCHLALTQDERAAEVLKPLADAAGTRWPPLAQVRLLLIHLRHNRLPEADALLHRITTPFLVPTTDMDQQLALRRRLEDLAALVPDELLLDTWRAVFQRQAGLSLFRVNRAHQERLEQFLVLERYFHLPAEDRVLARLALAFVYQQNDRRQLPRAIQTCEELLREDGAALEQIGFLVYTFDLYCWLLRENGEGGKALRAVDARLLRWPGFDPEFFRPAARSAVQLFGAAAAGPWTALPLLDLMGRPAYRAPALALLQARARLHRAVRRPDLAELDLGDYLRLAPPECLPYRAYANSLIQLGFLREERGDAAGAAAAWRRALFKNYPHAAVPPTRPDLTGMAQGADVAFGLMAGSLADDLTDADVDRLLDTAVHHFGHLLPPALAKEKFKQFVPTEVWRQTCQHARGRDGARHIVFHDRPPDECMRIIVQTVALEIARYAAFGGQMTARQEEAIWGLAGEGYATYFLGQLPDARVQRDMMAMYAIWNGVASPSWELLQWSLQPSLKAGLGYLYGNLYLRKGRPNVAATFLQTTVRTAPPGSDLSRLAQAELDRLKPGR